MSIGFLPPKNWLSKLVWMVLLMLARYPLSQSGNIFCKIRAVEKKFGKMPYKANPMVTWIPKVQCGVFIPRRGLYFWYRHVGIWCLVGWEKQGRRKKISKARLMTRWQDLHSLPKMKKQKNPHSPKHKNIHTRAGDDVVVHDVGVLVLALDQ